MGSWPTWIQPVALKAGLEGSVLLGWSEAGLARQETGSISH